MAGIRAQKLSYSQRTLKHRVLSDISRLIGCFLQELLFCKLEIHLTDLLDDSWQEKERKCFSFVSDLNLEIKGNRKRSTQYLNSILFSFIYFKNQNHHSYGFTPFTILFPSLDKDNSGKCSLLTVTYENSYRSFSQLFCFTMSPVFAHTRHSSSSRIQLPRTIPDPQRLESAFDL